MGKKRFSSPPSAAAVAHVPATGGAQQPITASTTFHPRVLSNPENDGPLEYATTWFTSTFHCLSDLTRDPRETCDMPHSLMLSAGNDDNDDDTDSELGDNNGEGTDGMSKRSLTTRWDDASTVPRCNKRGASTAAFADDGLSSRYPRPGKTTGRLTIVPQTPKLISGAGSDVTLEQFGGMTFMSADSGGNVATPKVNKVTPDRGNRKGR